MLCQLDQTPLERPGQVAHVPAFGHGAGVGIVGAGVGAGIQGTERHDERETRQQREAERGEFEE